MKSVIFASIIALLLAACSAKEINSTTDSMVGDVKNAFNSSKDTSSD